MGIRHRNVESFASMALVLVLTSFAPLQQAGVVDKGANKPQEGLVVSSDGVHLFYQVVGNGRKRS